ncbi:MAG: NUDIX domain-containing protein [Myxococcales bacterium]|nr:NUDIX domain-containing protein [Myxococcales bacterium]
MPMSPYMQDLRAKVGPDLILIPAVAAVIHDEAGRVLVLRQVTGHHSLPAGAIDPGESPREAVVREVREECGYEVVPSRLIDVFGGHDFRLIYPNGHVVEATACVFGCDVVGGQLRCDGVETTQAAWVPPEDVPAMLAVPFPDWIFEPPARRG